MVNKYNPNPTIWILVLAPVANSLTSFLNSLLIRFLFIFEFLTVCDINLDNHVHIEIHLLFHHCINL